MQLSRDALTAYLFSRGIWQAGRYAGTSSVDLGDNTGYIVTQTEPPGLRESQIAAVANPAGFDAPYIVPAEWQPQIAGMVYVPNWRKAVAQANNGGGIVEALAMAGIGAAVSAAAWGMAGSLAPGGASVEIAATGATEVAAPAITESSSFFTSETTIGATNVGETGLNWYSVDPGPDPFATTADVNAGWSYDGGYPGVDWYNNAGIGEAPDLWQSVQNATSSAANIVKSVGSIFATGSAALAATRNNLARPAPNYTRAAGGINLGLLAAAVVAWKLL